MNNVKCKYVLTKTGGQERLHYVVEIVGEYLICVGKNGSTIPIHIKNIKNMYDKTGTNNLKLYGESFISKFDNIHEMIKLNNDNYELTDVSR